jgi:hypothetical protein
VRRSLMLGMLRRRRFLMPSTSDRTHEGEYRLADWPKVLQVCGLVRP